MSELWCQDRLPPVDRLKRVRTLLIQMRDRIALACSLVMLAAFAYLLYDRGGPYLDRPATIVEHVYRQKHDTRDALLLLEDVRPLLPRGAQVACFSPDDDGKFRNDTAAFHAAVASLPYQFVLPPFSAAEGIPKNTLVEYVIAVDNPFTHPDYHLEAEYPTGRLYKVMR